MAREFTVVLRGYERKQVDAALARAFDALAPDGGVAQRTAARDALRAAEFEVALRGYDRLQVDEVVQGLLRELDNVVAGDDLRSTLGSVLRMSQPDDQLIVDEVRRLRELADQHNL
ncbi:DivIVA domain-containing protein [Paractinoplanes globisporus]|uniref:DivIVA domain-containing protein n=1 Tax=Paractinoplanes globisporus TaxID=113565 RepID=A0ABW6W7A9_9ACTN|nr:DivIVA domain-containing protein [Actinoplanes globisporus]